MRVRPTSKPVKGLTPTERMIGPRAESNDERMIGPRAESNDERMIVCQIFLWIGGDYKLCFSLCDDGKDDDDKDDDDKDDHKDDDDD
ncbi:hypothetical protein AVEN_135098-1 [Araneus ventricosus]|uniref:Uncharacterized protein n=1 Tax=Araneus ventricosus TaxID=182803 RepID=A0A4Y2M4E6_ARAVE|nr:hypothetical protein AVEN_135098-1 [Araneus ventricosus]